MEKIAADLLLKGLAPEGFADSQPIGLVTTDSREVCPGCIFVAFPGERFDGHDFAVKALEEGAAYVVLNHPVEGVPAERAVINPDSYHAMMVMGANYRGQFHPKVVGVTGSVGKTTTKQMTYAAIAGFGNTIKTEGNQNNELGLPRTIFRIGRHAPRRRFLRSLRSCCGPCVMQISLLHRTSLKAPSALRSSWSEPVPPESHTDHHGSTYYEETEHPCHAV